MKRKENEKQKKNRYESRATEKKERVNKNAKNNLFS